MTQLTQQRPPETVVVNSNRPRSDRSRALTVALILLVLLVGGGFSVARRFTEHKALVQETEKLAVPTVSVIKPASEPASDELVLPAQLQAFAESSIYSRTSGYVLRWYKDIGSSVKK